MEELRIPSLGCAYRAVTSPREFLELLDRLYREGGRNHVFVALNAEKICHAQKVQELRSLLAHSAANFIDGVGVVFAFWLLRKIRVRRTWGLELLLKTLADRRGTVFVFGSSESVNARAGEAIETNNPGLRVVGRCNGYYFSLGDLKEAITQVRPDLLIVALGSPKQEEWIWRYGRDLGARFVMGVGGALDAMVGEVVRSPRLMQRIGLEWFYRLIRQPQRIRRQHALIRFIRAVVSARMS